MVDLTKMSTISARIEETLAQQFENVANMISINKSDFIRSCIQKLCTDNAILLQHCDKVPEYMNYVKEELSKLPERIIKVKNGSWKDVKEATLFLLLDEFWKTSPSFFNNWKQILEEYHLTPSMEIEEFSDAKESDGLLGLDSIVMLMAEKSGQMELADMPTFLRGSDWVDEIEVDRISLSYACKKTFEKLSATTILNDYLDSERIKKESGPLRVVIDASGTFRRSGSVLYLPVDTAEIEVDNENQSEQRVNRTE